MNKNNILFHVPHSALRVTKEFEDRLTITKDEFQNINKFEADFNIDKLVPTGYERIVFPYSRMMCDVERFLDEDKEEMTKLKRGVVYELDCRGHEYITVDERYKQSIIEKYYKSHHKYLLEKVEDKIANEGNCLIIDLHSFSDEYCNDPCGCINKYENYPDICIGTNNNKTKALEKLLIELSHKFCYNISVNEPFSGSMVPLELIDSDCVESIMLEINKRIYMNDDYTQIDSEKATKLRLFIKEFCNRIESEWKMELKEYRNEIEKILREKYHYSEETTKYYLEQYDPVLEKMLQNDLSPQDMAAMIFAEL